MSALDFAMLTRKEIEKNFRKAGIYATSQLRKSLNTAQPYTRGPSGRHHGKSPSAAGHYPKKLSGQLQKSITWKFEQTKCVTTVGSNLKGYPNFLQTGTSLMRPRPWLSLFWTAERDNIGKILVGNK